MSEERGSSSDLVLLDMVEDSMTYFIYCICLHNSHTSTCRQET
jgi:hypothetical protein